MSRVREAVFDMLRSMDIVTDAEVLDLFSGSGAMGIEAVSQGAAHATLVDKAPAAIATITKNVERLGADNVRVVKSDVFAFVERAGHFDIAVIDPPFAFDEWERLLGLLKADVAVMESDRDISVPDGWEIVKSRRYGGSVVVIAESSQTANER